MKDKM